MLRFVVKTANSQTKIKSADQLWENAGKSKAKVTETVKGRPTRLNKIQTEQSGKTIKFYFSYLFILD